MESSFEPQMRALKRRVSNYESQSAITYPSRTIVHAKLEVTNPGDRDEQEADAMADSVVSDGVIARKISGGGNSSGIAVPMQMESRLMHSQGGGQPMPQELRSTMEGAFGQDFRQVRLHTDSDAADMSDAIHAKAFTHGNDIYFNQGQFTPDSIDGRRLLSHELTHVVQGADRIARSPQAGETPQVPADESAVDSFILERRPLISRYVQADNLLRDFHMYANNMLSSHIRFYQSLVREGRNSPYIVEYQRQKESYQKNLVYANGRGYAGTNAWIKSTIRSDAAPMYREILSNMQEGIFACWFTWASSSRGEDLLQQLEASRHGAAIDMVFTNQYGVKGVRSNATGINRLASGLIAPVERGNIFD